MANELFKDIMNNDRKRKKKKKKRRGVEKEEGEG